MIIRSTIKLVDFLADIEGLAFQPPGGIFTWKMIRVTNFSPFLCRITQTSDASNTPPQFVAPWQQNIYQYSGKKGAITVQPTTLSFTPTNLHGFFMVEFCDDENGFPGYYPVPLVGQIVIETKGSLGTIKEIVTGTPAQLAISNPSGPTTEITFVGITHAIEKITTSTPGRLVITNPTGPTTTLAVLASGTGTIDSVNLQTGKTGGTVTDPTGPHVVINFGAPSNVTTGTYNFTVGTSNTVTSGISNITGGHGNKVLGGAQDNLVVGLNNTIEGLGTQYANIVGGETNTITTTCNYNILSGSHNSLHHTYNSNVIGTTNTLKVTLTVKNSFIGGEDNVVSKRVQDGIIVGAHQVIVSSLRSAVVGESNVVDNANSLVAGVTANAAFTNSLTVGAVRTGQTSQFIELPLSIGTNAAGHATKLLTLQTVSTATKKIKPAIGISYALKVTVVGHENAATTTKLKTFSAQYTFGLTPKGTAPAHYVISAGGVGTVIYGHDYTPTITFSVVNTVTLTGQLFSQLQIAVTGPAVTATYALKVELVAVGNA